MLKKPRIRLALLVLIAAIAWPAAAAAQTAPFFGGPQVLPGKVAGPLQGTPADPSATTLHITPPRGGMVMLYRNNKILQWYTTSAMVTLRPGVAYGVTASRGGRLLFNQRLVLRPGLTQLSWSPNGAPALSYRPAFVGSTQFRRPARGRYAHPRRATRPGASRPSRRGGARRPAARTRKAAPRVGAPQRIAPPAKRVRSSKVRKTTSLKRGAPAARRVKRKRESTKPRRTAKLPRSRSSK